MDGNGGGLVGQRVSFFSVSYRPEHAGIGPYAAATAERLAEEGAQVHVLAGMPHYPSWQLSPEDRWRLRRHEVLHGVRITRLRQSVPRRQTAVTRTLYELSYFVHGLFAKQTWARADIVVAVVPALAGGLLATLAARRRGVPLILIVQDLTGSAARQSGILGGRWIAGLVDRIEAFLFRRADALGLIHDSLVESCLAAGVAPSKLHLVPNWSIHDPVDRIERLVGSAWSDRFVILHAGNMGLKQGLEVAVDAARLAHERGHDDLLFVLLGDGSQREHLTQLSEGLPTLQMRPPAPIETFPTLVGSADLALVTQRTSVDDMSVPSKLTAYWNAGRAVVASVSPGCGAAREVQRSGGGVVVAAQDPEALLEAVLSLQRCPERLLELEECGRSHAIKHLSAQSGLDRVVALVTTGAQLSA